MTSNAESNADHAPLPDLLGDFLGFTLAGCAPRPEVGALYNGIAWNWRGEGLLQLTPPLATTASPSIVVSAGVHGDETAPVELATKLIADLCSARMPLTCRLLVILGNIDAMRAATRYLDDDMNRMFGGRFHQFGTSREAPRAAALEQAVEAFYSLAHGERWHFDLHTAIRASVFEKFALLPATGGLAHEPMLEWIREAGLDAVLLHSGPSHTFTHYTASAHRARACTLELGKVRPFGMNDLAAFAVPMRALANQLGRRSEICAGVALPPVFRVIAQIEKHSDRFEFLVDPDVPNFTAFAVGTLIARDGDYRYEVTHPSERIVFPNPSVKPGLRAGLMAIERDVQAN
jgi:succinylglutamate desuccinylase